MWRSKFLYLNLIFSARNYEVYCSVTVSVFSEILKHFLCMYFLLKCFHLYLSPVLTIDLSLYLQQTLASCFGFSGVAFFQKTSLTVHTQERLTYQTRGCECTLLIT